MEDYIRPHVFVALRLPSGLHKVTQLRPNSTISLGKFGNFSVNDLIGRPFYHTYEIVGEEGQKRLRILSSTQIYDQDEIPEADLSVDQPDRAEEDGEGSKGAFEIVDQTGKVLMRTNRNILDDNAAQKLTMAEIEELKRAESASGRDIIAKIMESHSELDKKTTFSLAKYTTRKASKYLRRFVPVPLSVPFLARWWLYEKEAAKVMDMREELLSLIGSWSNVHYTDSARLPPSGTAEPNISTGRWLVVDETGGFLVAAMAEKLGILHAPETENGTTQQSGGQQPAKGEKQEGEGVNEKTARGKDTNVMESEDTPIYGIEVETRGDHASSVGNGNVAEKADGSQEVGKTQTNSTTNGNATGESKQSASITTRRPVPASVLAQESHMNATENSITVIHTNNQPNLSMLTYYNYHQDNSQASHPLHRHLKTVSWLQLLHPEEDPTYEEPEVVEKESLDKWKSAKRGAYYRKRRRWERVRSVIDQTRYGGFDGLIVASVMAPASIAHHLVPLLRGGAQAVVYSANIEPLAELADYYSTARKSAFLGADLSPEDLPNEDFPVNPTLLLSPAVHTARVRPWQVLPGRTHPLMTGIGGPEGYVFSATRVLPIEGERIEARGSFKRRKTARAAEASAPVPQT